MKLDLMVKEFRVFSPELKKMYKEFDLVYGLNECANDNHIYGKYKDTDIFLQDTKHKDKYFNRIWEGDIVNLVWARYCDDDIKDQVVIKCVFYFGMTGNSSWFPNWGNLIMKPLMTRKDFERLTRGLKNQFNPYGNHWETEIIGNVFENPELTNF